MNRLPIPIAAGLALAALSTTHAASAQTFVQGTVVDPASAGVVNVDIDAFDSSGAEASLSNDATGAGGAFLAQVNSGPGTYDLRFSPPPGVALLPKRLEDVLIIGTKNVGTVTLASGFLVEGRLLDGNGNPMFNVALRVEESASGADVEIAHGVTDVAGEFRIALPAGTFDIGFDPFAAYGTSWAPQLLRGVVVGAALDVGDVACTQGFLIKATCEKAGGLKVAGLDLDVIDSATGQKVFTPGDGSDSGGFVDVVVPAGTYDLQFEPLIADKLVAQQFESVVVGTSDVDYGTLLFAAGRYLSGKVTGSDSGAGIAGVDLDVFDAVTGVEIPLSSDNTDSAGNYQVVVPIGTYDLDFEPALTQIYAAKVVAGVAVSADKVQNVALDPCTQGSKYGSGVPGSGGFTPSVDSVGDRPRLGAEAVNLRISGGLGGATAFFTLGTASAAIPFKAGTLLVDSAGVLLAYVALPLSGPAGVPGAGSFDLVDGIPDDPALEGVAFYAQALVLDVGAVKKVAMSDGLEIVVCR